ncbi:hypothetical protein JGH11_18925 [Dysgonomonas sp. Marseille-P4677]|nr:hypothetical protein [Dysgonomonas sp. Marseille-P4677]
MKKALLFLFAILLTFASCSDEDKPENILNGSIWTQDIGDKSHWFFFIYDKDFRDKGAVSYVETGLGDDPYNYIIKSVGYFEIDKNNDIKIYNITDERDPDTGYPKINMLFTGYLKDNKIYLEGDGINGEGQIFELTQYIYPKQ